MKPRNRREREVVQLSHSLITRQSDLDWIEKRHKVGSSEYFAVYEVKGDWQVIRMFMYRSYTKKYEVFHEPLRYWIKNDGTYVIEAKNRNTMGNHYIDSWKVGSELSICPNQGYYRDVRELYANYTRIHSLLPELRRINAFRADNYMVNNLMPFWFVHSLLTNNRVETFFKLNQKWLTWKFYHYDKLTETLWQSIRVALRHGYHWDSKDEINDWCDMIGDLEYLGLDTRNPHYICPSNLYESHQHLIEKTEQKRENKRREEERKKIAAYEPTFYENRKMFFGMLFKDGHIRIQIITTAQGIIEEGTAMHHCVGGYYNKPYSLILSATINGKRVETIEVDLHSFQLIQSRGLQNKSTKYHKRIVSLIENNMEEIRERFTKAA